MKKKAAFLFLIVVILVFPSSLNAQQSLTGAYGGSEFYTSASGMIRNDKVIYFRSDGTYARKLNQKDWQTRVDGRYTLNGNKITLTAAKDGKQSHATLKPNGELTLGGATLLQFDRVNSLPAQTFEYKMAISGTGGAYGGGQSQNLLSFDGNGNFSHSEFHGTLVIGSGVGGGKVNSSAGDGTYTIKNSELTLHYKNGETTRMSFFLSPGKSVVALINGRLYYPPKNERKTSRSSTSTPKKSTEIPKGKELLEKARLAHGGTSLDEWNTFQMTGMMGEVQLVMTGDLVKQWMRYEFYQNNRLIAVEQLEKNRGWMVNNGHKSAMASTRIKEIQMGMVTGIFGLQSANLKKIKVLKTEKNPKGGTNVYIEIAGQPYAWILDDQYRLIGEGTEWTGTQQLETSTDFKAVDHILWPFTQHETSGNQNFTLKWDKIEINPVLSENTWKEP